MEADLKKSAFFVIGNRGDKSAHLAVRRKSDCQSDLQYKKYRLEIRHSLGRSFCFLRRVAMDGRRHCYAALCKSNTCNFIGKTFIITRSKNTWRRPDSTRGICRATTGCSANRACTISAFFHTRYRPGLGAPVAVLHAARFCAHGLFVSEPNTQ